jgi:hypothetical protein
MEAWFTRFMRKMSEETHCAVILLVGYDIVAL